MRTTTSRFARGLMALGAVMVMQAGAASAAPMTVEVFAKANSISGGVGVSTLLLDAGDQFSVSVDPKDLWNAGPLPRWSNADGLVVNLFATGADESGQPAGTKIGQPFGLYTKSGFTAPYGALVGRVGASYILLGTSYAGVAPAAGTLQLFYWDSNNSDNTEKVAVTVQAVPEPASLLVFGSALIGLAAGARRRR